MLIERRPLLTDLVNDRQRRHWWNSIYPALFTATVRLRLSAFPVSDASGKSVYAATDLNRQSSPAQTSRRGSRKYRCVSGTRDIILSMEGLSVKDRILSIQSNAGSTPSLRFASHTSHFMLIFYRSPASTRTAQKPSTEKSFAEAGARLSFQKRVNESLQNSTPKAHAYPTSRADDSKSNFGENRKLESLPEPTRQYLTSPSEPTHLERSNSSGALEAAAIASLRKGAPNPIPLGSPLRTRSNKPPGTIIRNGTDSLQPSTIVKGAKGAELAAAKASVQRSNTMPLQTKGNDFQTPGSLAGSTISFPLETAISATKGEKSAFQEKRSDAPATVAKPSVAPAHIGVLSSSSIRPQASTQAARSVALKQSPSVTSLQQSDRETRFGVILSRSVSPAPDRKETSFVGHVSPPKTQRSIYQLPEAAASEPLLRSYSSSAAQSVVRTHKLSPLGPVATRPKIGIYESSSEASSLADVGALTAMSSRSSSATSLPVTMSETIDSQSHMGAGARRRPVHLKATMRKETRPDREKGHHVHAGPICISEAERKRYEGVWASNHRQDSASILSEESNYIDNLTVRELWIRSSLPDEFLGHIWYVPGTFIGINEN